MIRVGIWTGLIRSDDRQGKALGSQRGDHGVHVQLPNHRSFQTDWSSKFDTKLSFKQRSVHEGR